MESCWAKRVIAPTQVERLERPILRVAVVPNHPNGMGNRMFQGDFVANTNWMDANLEWYRFFRNSNVELGTIDIIPPEEANVILFYDLPARRAIVEETRARNPAARLILVLYESPAVAPHAFNPSNHQLFDLVLTYNPLLEDQKKYQRLFLPIGYPPQNLNQLSFKERRLCVMLNSRISTNPLDLGRPWSFMQPYRRIKAGGWKISIKEIIAHRRKTAYHRRDRFARAAEKASSEPIDVYGANWHPLCTGWYRRFVPQSPYECHRGSFQEDKLKLLQRYKFVFSFENYCSNCGYISEKIFDTLYAGSVPVYLGDANIQDYVPSSCFVDARSFTSDASLIRYLSSIAKEEWEAMKSEGAAFISHSKAAIFQPRNFAKTMANAVQKVMQLDSSDLFRYS